MRKKIFILMVFTFLSRLTGFLREIFLANKFGAGLTTDIYFASMIVPVLIISFVVTGLNNSLIPTLSKTEKEGKKTHFFNNLMSLLIIVGIAITIALFVFAEPLNKLFVGDFKPQSSFSDVVLYSRWMSIIAIFQIFTFAYIGYLQQSERFYMASFVSVPLNFLIILGVIFAKNTSDVKTLVYWTIIGYLAQMIWVWAPYKKISEPFKFRVDLKDQDLRNMIATILPVILILSASQINYMVSKSFATSLSEGSISYLTYSQKIIILFQQILVVTFSMVVFTKQAKLVSDNNIKGMLEVSRDNLYYVLMLVLPVVVGTMVLSIPIVQVLYERGMFSTEDSLNTAGVLLWYAPSLIPFALTELLSKMFFSMNQYRKVMTSAIAGMVLNIILSYILVRLGGLNGLASASSIAAILAVLLLLYNAKQVFKEYGLKLYSQSIIKITVASILMGALIYGLRTLGPFTSMNKYVTVMVMGVIGALSYFFFLLLLKTEEVTPVLSYVRQRLSNKERREER
ncbi:murein biosynthesis integral membrane protein MurJ [Guggenheimella bovis]